MIRREIVLDEESNEVLESLAEDHQGDASLVIRELLRMHGLPESDLDTIEESQAEALRRQKERSEREFQEGNVVPWSELKRECGL